MRKPKKTAPDDQRQEATIMHICQDSFETDPQGLPEIFRELRFQGSSGLPPIGPSLRSMISQPSWLGKSWQQLDPILARFGKLFGAMLRLLALLISPLDSMSLKPRNVPTASATPPARRTRIDSALPDVHSSRHVVP